MTSNKEVARRFALREFPKHGDELNGSHLFIRGKVVYSYGSHFPVAMWLSNNEVLFNSDKYSNTTAHHKSDVMSAINRNCPYVKCIFVTTQEFQSILREKENKNEGVIFVTRPFATEKLTFDDLQRTVIPTVLKANGLSMRKANFQAKKAVEAWKRIAIVDVL